MSVSGIAVAALLAGCGNAGQPKDMTARAGGDSSSATSAVTTASQTASPMPTKLSNAEAAARYKALAATYAQSRKDLDAALDADSPSLKVIRAGAKKAAAGYQARIKGLIDTAWPRDVQPYIDRYVELSGYGLETLNAAAQAKSLSDLLDSGDEADTRKLNAADAVVRTKLGLPLSRH